MSLITRALDGSMATLDRLSHVASAVGLVLLLALVVTLAQSVFWAEHVPFAMKASIAGLWMLSVVRPAHGLLVVAGLVPLGHMIGTRVFGAYPARGTEAIVLAFLAGYALRLMLPALRRRWSLVRGRPPSGRQTEPEAPIHLLVPIVVFGAVVVASCIVQYAVVQVWQDHPWPFFESFLDFISRRYHYPAGDFRPWADHAGFGFVAFTIFTLEGPILLLVTYLLCRREPGLFTRLATMTVAGAVGAASLTYVTLAADALSQAEPLEALPALLGERREAMFTPKLNTAASLFVLAAPLAFAVAVSSTRGRIGWLLAGAFVMLTLWLNGTRAALLAAIFVAVIGIGWSGARRLFRGVRAGDVTILLLVGLGLVASASYHLFGTTATTAQGFEYRLQFTETGLRMWASRPLFGVGIGQYWLHSERFAPAELLGTAFQRATAHNEFLQVAAELGAVGLVSFGCLIAAALIPAIATLRTSRRDPWLLGALAGTIAFLITTLSSGHPMLVEVTTYPFWIVFGLLIARPSQLAATRASDEVSADDAGRCGRAGGVWRWLTAVTLVILLVSLPARLERETGRIDLTRVAYGLHGWEEGSRGERYRWSSDRATLFARPGSQIVVPVRARPNRLAGRFEVDVRVGGRHAARLQLEDAAWHSVALAIPPADSTRAVPVDIRVTPTWRPVDVSPNSNDRRELGVMIGELAVSPAGTIQSPNLQ